MSVSVMCVCMYVCVPVNKQLESKEFKLAVKCGTPPHLSNNIFQDMGEFASNKHLLLSATNAKLTAPDIWGLSDFE